MSLAQEFKEFAVKGNVIDMAVGVIIGGAFGKIVSSFVADILMPVLGTLIGGVNFSEQAVQLGANPAGEPVLLKYGVFLQNVLDFVIIAFAIFMAIRGINKLKKEEPAPPPPGPSPEAKLLMEIRDLLKK